MRAGPRLLLGNVSARLVLDGLEDGEARDAVLEWFDDYLTFTHSRWVRQKGRSKPKHLVEETRLLARDTLKFPGGLVRRLLRSARDDALDAIEDGRFELEPLAYLQLEDGRTPPCAALPIERWPEVAPWLSTWTPDDPEAPDYRFQTDAVRAVVEKVGGILSVPTGGGKTEIAVACSLVLPCRWLFLVPGKDLLHQTGDSDTAERVGRYTRLTGQEAGLIGDGQWSIPEGCRFVVATFQTLSRALRARDPRALELLGAWAQGLVVDESHTLPADSFYEVAMAARAAYYRVGISATPLDRTDRRSVLAIAALGRIIYRITVPELVARNVLALPTIHFVPVEQEIERPTWQGAYGRGITRSALRNKAVVDVVSKRAARPGFVFVKEVQHGKELVKRLEKAGLRVSFVWGAKDANQRTRALTRLERGDLDFIVANVVFRQGIDTKALRSVVNAAAMASPIAAIQQIGRGTRRDKGKTAFDAWDFDDQGNKHLEKWTRARRKAYQKEGFPIVDELLLSSPRSPAGRRGR